MRLSVVIPVYNEEENLPFLMEEIAPMLSSLGDGGVELLFVDDGSQDGSLAFLRALADCSPYVRVISFSRNFGGHAAAMAGFLHSSGDAVAILPADLQEPPELLLRMLEQWERGYQTVWALRESREDPLLTRLTSRVYSRLMHGLGLRGMPDVGLDICLVDRQVVDTVVSMREKNTSIVGLILWSGFKQTFVPYRRRARRCGRSRWTLARRIKLFIDSFVSFSFFPIRIVSCLGLAFSGLGLLYAAVVVLQRLLYRVPIPGWSSLIVAVVGFSGLQLLMLGIVAEYLWRTFDQSRGRPPYIIKEFIGAGAPTSPPRTAAMGHTTQAPSAELTQ